MTVTLKSIYSFSNYRAYIEHYCDHQRTTRKVTYRQMAARAKMGSENYFQMVISGRRNLTVENVFQFAKAMELPRTEHRYFELLVLENQAKSAELKAYYREELKALKRTEHLQKVTAKLPEILSSWYFPGIIAVLMGSKEGVNLNELSKLTGVPSTQIEGALAVLKQKALIRELANGKVMLEENYFAFNGGAHFNFDRFQKEQIERSLKALQKRKTSGAKFFALSFTIAKGRVAHFGERLRTFAEEIVDEANQDPPQEILQLNMQLFPLKDTQK